MSEDNLDKLYNEAKKIEQEDELRYFEIIVSLANKGHSKSQVELGSIYLAGFGLVEKNIDTALSWFLKAESSGDAENFFSLGMLYEESFDGPNKSFVSDEKKSKYYYKLAFDVYMERARSGDVAAMYRISEMYNSGIGVEVNKEEAKTWYDKFFALRESVGTRQL